jgi:hypothetical protein
MIIGFFVKCNKSVFPNRVNVPLILLNLPKEYIDKKTPGPCYRLHSIAKQLL